jgi:2-polyprenyl-6-methoxyphenol hydroxylase-like FAD-dependent oxidoreductase
MKREQLKVIIIGAGTGGLCLAHGLRAAGLDVEVFERDCAPTDRLQGYRLHINATGNRALKACLPETNFERFVAASAQSNRGITFLDHRLNRLLAMDFPQVERAAPMNERPVSRIALRQVLLEGLEEVVQFGKKFVAFEDAPQGRVTALFEDGSRATGDVLVGADGASSRVRARLLPHAKRVDTGIVAVTGKFGLDEAARRETPRAIFRGPTPILGPSGCFLFASAVEYPRDQPNPVDNEEYVMWGFSAHRETLALPGNLGVVSGETARDAVLSQMDHWHPALRRLVKRAELPTISAFAVKSSVPIAPWSTRNVTVLGDALHNMTPFRGSGANTALRDAAALREALVTVYEGRRDLLPALADYERAMLDYGFAAVLTSLKAMKRLHSRSVVQRFATRLRLRTMDALPPLQKIYLAAR